MYRVGSVTFLDFLKMDSRTKGVTKQLPPHLSDLLHTLSENGRRFIELYESKKEKMQAIATELWEISEKVKEVQKGANTTRLVGAACGGLGIAAAILAGVSSAGKGAVLIAVLGCTVAIVGGTGVVKANMVKAIEEKISVETVEKLGKEFIDITEPQRVILEDIMVVSQELKEKSSSLRTTTGEQAKRGLSETKQLQQFLRQTAEPAQRSREVMDVTPAMQRGVMDLPNFISRITSTPKDVQLRNYITYSALQCEKSLNEFANMRKILKDFEDM